MSLRYRRNAIKKRTPTRQLGWRPRTAADQLPDLPQALGKRPGSQRCGVVGLERGDCPQDRYRNGLCRYHWKLAKGMLDPSGDLYPVWPIPLGGYVLTESYRKVA